MRNSLRYASKKYWSKITGQLREVYTAPTIAAAEARFAEFAEQWRSLYPAMTQMWESAWGEFVPFLKFPPEIRRLIYTTKGIESLNARFRQATRRRGHFPNEQAAMKVLYPTVLERRPNRTNPTGPIASWKAILNTLSITYGDRLGINQAEAPYTKERTDPDRSEAVRSCPASSRRSKRSSIRRSDSPLSSRRSNPAAESMGK